MIGGLLSAMMTLVYFFATIELVFDPLGLVKDYHFGGWQLGLAVAMLACFTLVMSSISFQCFRDTLRRR